MEEEVKVSELPSASSVDNEDLVMIVQNGFNKKISKEELFKDTEEEIADLVTELNPSNWVQATINNNVMAQGGFYYAKLGRFVVIDIEDARATNDITTNRTVIASGFPPAKRQINFTLTRAQSTDADNVCRIAIDTEGNLILWYDTMYSGTGKEYYGQVVYLSNE